MNMAVRHVSFASTARHPHPLKHIFGFFSSCSLLIIPFCIQFQDSSLLKKDCLLFYYPDCEGLAKRIAGVSGNNVELAEITWK